MQRIVVHDHVEIWKMFLFGECGTKIIVELRSKKPPLLKCQLFPKILKTHRFGHLTSVWNSIGHSNYFNIWRFGPKLTYPSHILGHCVENWPNVLLMLTKPEQEN